MSAPTTDPAEPVLEAPPGDPLLESPVEAGDAAAGEAVPTAHRRARRGPTGLPVWLAGPIAAAWTAFIGLVAIALPMTVVWAVSMFPGMGIADAARNTGTIWLVSHDIALRIGSATYSLLPWGLMLVWLLLLVIAGRWAARTTGAATVRDGALLIVSGALGYGALLAAVSAVVATPDVRTSPARAFGFGFVLGVIGLAWGALRRTPLGAEARARIPAPATAIMLAALAAGVALIAQGAVLLAIALAASFDEALRMQQFLDPGAVGGLVLLILAIGYLPTAVMWSIAYALGAGITVGPGIVLSPFIQAPAPTSLPAFPMLAALPEQTGPAAFALPVIGVVAGVVAGLVIARRVRMAALQRLGLAVIAVALAALALAMCMRISFGSLGDVRLIDLGPSSESVALVSGILMLVGAVPAVLVAGRREEPADVR